MSGSRGGVKDDSPYGYTPTMWTCILFIVLFTITTAFHTSQAVRSKLWWLLPTLVLCGVGEIIGWAGRLWSSKNPRIMDPFLMQICCTVFAPSFMTAGMFIIFGKIITRVGREYSRLEPKHCRPLCSASYSNADWWRGIAGVWRADSILFIAADVAALVVQSIGGAKASAADTLEAANKGAKTMVVGIIMQMVAITIYVVIQLEFVIRVVKNKPVRRVQRDEIETATPEEKGKAVTGAEGGEDIELPARPGISRKTWLMLLGLVLSTVLIYVRSIYRTIELLDGWHGPIITKEKLFDLLDGMPIVLAMVSLNIFHPGRLI